MESKIAIFYHIAKMGNWKKVDEQIMGKLRDSGLLAKADVFVRNECSDTKLYEFPTIHMLDEFSLRNNNYSILYIHTKGVSRLEPTIEDWRECMLYWNVERWRECKDKLDKGYDAVGINVVDMPIRHFQGNFWWANAEHIRTLGTVDSITFKDRADLTHRHKAEFWVLSKPCRVYSPYHHRINPYMKHNPRVNYEGLKF